jgi:predicted MFS family arabinose efflux permease
MFVPIIAYLIGSLLDWRFAFIFFGALSVFTGIVMGRIPRERERLDDQRTPLYKVILIPHLWILLVFNIVNGFFVGGVDLFFPTFLSLNRGLKGELAATASSLVLFFGVIGQIIGGKATDRYDPKKVLIATSLGILASMLLLLLLPLGILGIIFFIVIYGISVFGHQPAMTTLLGLVSPRNLMGMTYGVMFFFTFGIGSLSTTLAGYLADLFSLEIAFWILTIFSVLTLAISLTIPKVIKD